MGAVRDVFDIQVGTAILSELAVYQDSDVFADLMNGQSLFQLIMFWLGGDIEGRLTDRIRPSETFPRGIDGRFITTLRVHFEDTTLVDPQTWEQFGRHVTDLTVGGEL